MLEDAGLPNQLSHYSREGRDRRRREARAGRLALAAQHLNRAHEQRSKPRPESGEVPVSGPPDGVVFCEENIHRGGGAFARDVLLHITQPGGRGEHAGAGELRRSPTVVLRVGDAQAASVVVDEPPLHAHDAPKLARREGRDRRRREARAGRRVSG